MVKRVLISVYDKSGLEELVSAFKEYDVEIISSGGTARKIKEMGYPKLEDVATYTGHPESPGGLLKTLHPRIHGGFLLNRETPEHGLYLEKHGIIPFDMLVRAVVTNPSQYKEVIKSLKENNGEIPVNMIKKLAVSAFKRTAEYDKAIVTYLEKEYWRLYGVSP